MPYKSKAQQRKFHAMAAKGEISSDVVKEFDKATKKKKGGFAALPEKKNDKKAMLTLVKRAFNRSSGFAVGAGISPKEKAIFTLIKRAQALKVGTAKGKKLRPGSFKGGKSEPSSKAKIGEGGRFKALENKLSKKKKVKDPKALAASIMYAKYGKGKGQAIALKGR